VFIGAGMVGAHRLRVAGHAMALEAGLLFGPAVL